MNKRRRNRTYQLYWLHTKKQTDPATQGYVGVTGTTMAVRLRRHRRHPNTSKPLPKSFEVTIFYRGTKRDCFAREIRLRPDHHIGWNKARGGFHDGRSRRGMTGPPHTEKTKRIIAIKAKARAKTRKGHATLVRAARILNGAAWIGRPHKESTRQLISAKLTAIKSTRKGRRQQRQAALSQGSGKDHPRYGQHHTDEVKAVIAQKALGRKRTKRSRQDQSKSMRERWKDPVYLAKMRARSTKLSGKGHWNYRHGNCVKT